MKKTNKQNGITIVALVITIIILLILAGISIASLTQTGLFAKALQAKQETENAQAEENATLAEYEQWMENYIGGTGKKLKDTDDTKPAQAMPAKATVIENDLSKGIVIKDSNNNEWVWVVVPKSIYGDSVTSIDYEGIYNALNTYASPYREGSATQNLSWKDEWYDGCGIVATADKTGIEVYTEMYKKMLSSIYTNGGFWISRYEAGIAGTNTDATSKTILPERNAHSDITSESPKAVSQANRMPYNYVKCSEAQSLASEMSTDTSKTSSLLFGIQWDLVCKYLEVNVFNGTSSSLNSNSTSWGNYSNNSLTLKDKSRYCTSPSTPSPNGDWSLFNVTGSFVQLTVNYLYKTNSDENCSGLLTTGASENANKMNIYDFAGNEWEWTLEHAISDTSNHCAFRGGCYNDLGSELPASSRSNYYTNINNVYIGFRSAMY